MVQASNIGLPCQINMTQPRQQAPAYLIHDHHGALLEECPGEAQQLALPHAQIGAPIAHILVQPLSQRLVQPHTPGKRHDGGQHTMMIMFPVW
jgi:hypothetical protein